MFKITIEATSKKDQASLPLLAQEVCYWLDSELNIQMRPDFKWDGNFSGDDGYFELQERIVKVITKGQSCTKE